MQAEMAPPKKKPGNKADRHTKPKETFHLPQEMLDALYEYLDATEPRPDKSEVMRVALKRFLEEKGFWPTSRAGG